MARRAALAAIRRPVVLVGHSLGGLSTLMLGIRHPALTGKAIIVLNPAEPPMIMRDTVHCLTVDAPKQKEIEESVRDMLAEVRKYVPGYRVMNGPVFDGNRVTTFLQVEGLGDYLPKYAGNLDIMTAAAARTAEMFAEEILNGRLAPAAA